MRLKKLTSIAAILIGALSSTAAFGAINDREDVDAGGNAAFVPKSEVAAPASRSRVPVAETYVAESGNRAWSVSPGLFYAGANDDCDSTYGSKIDLYGFSVLLNREFNPWNSFIAFDLGAFAIFGYGEGDYAGRYRESRYTVRHFDYDISQYDAMFGVQGGVKFLIGNDVSVGIGVLVGADCRYGELDDYDETAVGFVYGGYANVAYRLTARWSIFAAYNLLMTNVDYSEDLDGLEDEISYHMFSVGVGFSW